MDLNGVRYLFQWIALIGSNCFLGFVKTRQVYQGSLKSACVPFLNCHSCPSAFFSCPIGTMQHFMTMHRLPFLLIGYLAAVGLMTGAMACGWLCPFGFIQDLMYKIKTIKIRIPAKLSGLRWLVLVFLVLLIPYITQETWFSKLCPMGTIQAAIPWAVWNPIIPVYGERVVTTSSLGALFAVKILILFTFLILFVISKRPFCRLACPLGAILGFFNKYSILRLKVDNKNCSDCDRCSQACPVDNCVGQDANASTCVRCLKCLKCENVKLTVGDWSEAVPLEGLKRLQFSKKKSGAWPRFSFGRKKPDA